MIASILFGRRGSRGLPGKNTRVVLGMPLAAYPLKACRDSGLVDAMFVSTDDPEIVKIGREWGADHLERPPHLCADDALLEEAIHDAFLRVRSLHEGLRIVVITQCNAPYVNGPLVREAITILQRDPGIDSVITAIRLDGFAPERARTVDGQGNLVPYVPFEKFGREVTCDRSSQLPVYFFDSALTVVRARCLHDLQNNMLPFRWMGQRIKFIEQPANPGDIDFEWQLPIVEHWLQDMLENGD